MRYIDPDGRIQRDANGKVIYEKYYKEGWVSKQVTEKRPGGIDGTSSALFMLYKYEIGYIFADDGTKIGVKKLLNAVYAKVRFKGEVQYGDPEVLDMPAGFDATSNCHGFTFADNEFSIDDSAVSAILIGDGYKVVGKVKGNGKNASSSFKGANIVVFYNHKGEVIHTARVNADGTYSDNAGFEKVQHNKIELQGANSASRGMDFKEAIFYRYDP